MWWPLVGDLGFLIWVDVAVINGTRYLSVGKQTAGRNMRSFICLFVPQKGIYISTGCVVLLISRGAGPKAAPVQLRIKQQTHVMHPPE